MNELQKKERRKVELTEYFAQSEKQGDYPLDLDVGDRFHYPS